MALQRLDTGTRARGGEASPIVRDVLGSSGRPLEPRDRTFFAAYLGQDFEHVRLHTDARAADSARAVHARAYTVGNDIVFGARQYRPGTVQGRLLLAHELTHVSQPRGSVGSLPARIVIAPRGTRLERDAAGAGAALAAGRAPPLAAGSAPLSVQRIPAEEMTPQIVGQDPGLLLCFILCEIGVPPSLWRTITQQVLEACWEEYRDRHGALVAQARFRRLQLAFMSYSPLLTAKFVLSFVVQGKIGPITVRVAAAPALRESLRQMLLRRGRRGRGS